MTPEIAIDVCRRAIQTILMCAAPPLVAGLLIGLVVSVFQAATQINEQTLTFVPKIVAVFVTILIFGAWTINSILEFTRGIFDLLATL